MRRKLVDLSRVQLYQGFAAVCLILVVSVGFNAVTYVENRDQAAAIRGLKAQRAAEERAKVEAQRVEARATYGRCIASINSVKNANAIIGGFRDFLIDNIKDSQRLLDADPRSPDAAVRRMIIAKRKVQVMRLRLFPTVTKEWCVRRRDAALRRINA